MLGLSHQARQEMLKEFPAVCEGCGMPVDLRKVQSNDYGILFVLCSCGRCNVPRIPEQLRKVMSQDPRCR